MDDFDRVCSFDALYRGLTCARRNVMWKDSTSGYSYDGLKNTVKLQDALRSGEYEIMPYQRFMIHEPKEREIVATRIRDRQFQRSLCDEALYREMTRGWSWFSRYRTFHAFFQSPVCQRLIGPLSLRRENGRRR